jgi:CDP-diacylglycerol--serine O-phosphatidyltransferase
MLPRFVGRLGLADAVTVTNAAFGFAASAAVLVDPGLAARLILLAAIADGLDGILARKAGCTDLGETLDALADVASFCVAPALFVFSVVSGAWGDAPLGLAVAVGVPALYVAMGVVRLALYTAHDPAGPLTVGVPTTLAATVIASGYLAGLRDPTFLLVAAAVFAYLMVTDATYPDLYDRDALIMGVVQTLAVVAPAAVSRLFPRLLLAWALAYLLLGPRFYWRETAADGPSDAAATDPEDAQSSSGASDPGRPLADREPGEGT